MQKESMEQMPVCRNPHNLNMQAILHELDAKSPQEEYEVWYQRCMQRYDERQKNWENILATEKTIFIAPIHEEIAAA